MIRVTNPGYRMGWNPDEPEDNPEALEMVYNARYCLIMRENRPFLATPVMALRLVESHDPSLKTAAVDSSWRMYYNAEFILNSPIEAVASVIEHEVWHLLRKHGPRARAQNVSYWAKDLWNIACDAEIHNDTTIYNGVKKTGITPINAESIGCETGQDAEAYYEHLEDNAGIYDYQYYKVIIVFKDKATWDAANPGVNLQKEFDLLDPTISNPIDLINGFMNEVVPYLNEWLKKNADDVVHGLVIPKFGGGGGFGDGDGGGEGPVIIYVPGGSGATDIPESWEKAPDGQMSDSEAEAARRDTAKGVQHHYHQHGKKGTAGDLLDWAEAVLKGKVDWRKELRSAITNAVQYVRGNLEPTWSRVSRRQAAVPHVRLTGTHSPDPEIAVILDISGSMGWTPPHIEAPDKSRAATNIRMLDLAIAELDKILKTFGGGTGVRVFVTDTEIKSAQKVFGLKNLHLPRDPSGGTDMVVGFEAAAKANPRPNVVVCLTDGYTDWPKNPIRGSKTVVGLVGVKRGSEDGVIQTVPKWAKVVCIL